MTHDDEASAWVKQTLAEIFTDREYEDLYARLLRSEPAFEQKGRDLFCSEYLAAKLALTSLFWRELCRASALGSGESEDLFFKAVMQCFQGSNMALLAAAYSEYCYAPEQAAEHPPAVIIGLKLLARLGFENRIHPSSSRSRPDPCVRLLVETFEAYRVYFENRFEEAVPLIRSNMKDAD